MRVCFPPAWMSLDVCGCQQPASSPARRGGLSTGRPFARSPPGLRPRRRAQAAIGARRSLPESDAPRQAAPGAAATPRRLAPRPLLLSPFTLRPPAALLQAARGHPARGQHGQPGHHPAGPADRELALQLHSHGARPRARREGIQGRAPPRPPGAGRPLVRPRPHRPFPATPRRPRSSARTRAARTRPRRRCPRPRRRCSRRRSTASTAST
jgi:hypothetical protein